MGVREGGVLYTAAGMYSDGGGVGAIGKYLRMDRIVGECVVVNFRGILRGKI